MSMQYEVNFNAAAMINAIESLKALGLQGGGSGGKDEQLEALQKEAEKQTLQVAQTQPFFRRLMKSTGIQFNLASILKQSQIFTGTIGSVFQIIGALVDVILAPFLPILVPAIRLLGRMIPHIHKLMQSVVGFFIDTFSWDAIDKRVAGWIDWLADKFPDFPGKDTVVEGMKNAPWGAIGTGLGFMLLNKKFGIVGKLLTKVPGMSKLLGHLTKIPMMGKVLGFLGVNAKTQAKVAEKVSKAGKAQGLALKDQAKYTKAASKTSMLGKVGGLFSKGGAKGLLKGALLGGKAIPLLGTALLAAQGIGQTISTVSHARKSGATWGDSLKSGAMVAGTTAAFAAGTFVPGLGVAAGLGGTFAIDAMAEKMKSNYTIQVNVDGEEKTRQEIEADKAKQTRVEAHGTTTQVTENPN